MARISYGTIVTNIKGSIGGTTYAVNRSGSTAKARIVGKKNINHNQAQALSISLSVTKAWNELSNTNKNLFNSYALANAFTDRFGDVKILTGFQWFKQLCQTNLYFNGSFITTPPAYSIPTALPSFTATLSSSAIVVTWSMPIDPSITKVYLFATPPIRGNARTQRATYKLIDVRALDLTSSFDITDKWNNTFGLDYTTIATGSLLNINIMAFPVNATSLVSSAAQFSTGSKPLAGLGFMAIGSTFIVS